MSSAEMAAILSRPPCVVYPSSAGFENMQDPNLVIIAPADGQEPRKMA